MVHGITRAVLSAITFCLMKSIGTYFLLFLAFSICFIIDLPFLSSCGRALTNHKHYLFFPFINSFAPRNGRIHFCAKGFSLESVYIKRASKIKANVRTEE